MRQDWHQFMGRVVVRFEENMWLRIWIMLRESISFKEKALWLGPRKSTWSNDLAIARTTPALLGLFSLVTLMAHERWQGQDCQRQLRFDPPPPT